MSEGTAALLVFIGVAVATAVAMHSFVRRYASILSGFVAAGVFLGIGVLREGHLSPLWQIVYLQLWVYASVISLVIGIPFTVRRKPKPPGCCKDCGYNLTGNVSGICPECGSAIEAAQTVAHTGESE